MEHLGSRPQWEAAAGVWGEAGARIDLHGAALGTSDTDNILGKSQIDGWIGLSLRAGQVVQRLRRRMRPLGRVEGSGRPVSISVSHWEA
ncbi:MAG: hypothetical protein LC749_04410 [Actinobacteria bacterium]|nr:hypothetical protein [Actinomycetota bacterium]